MPKVPTPEELRMEEKKQEIAKSSKLATVVDRMPEKRRRLLLAMVAFPDKSDRELLKLAGVRGIKKESVFKEVGGKLSAVLKDFGVTQADIARNLHQCLNATRTIRVRMAVVDDKGKTTYVTEVEHVPDFTTRLKATELIAKLGDYFPALKTKAKLDIDTHHYLTAETKALLEHRETKQVDAQFEVVEDARPS